MTLPVGSRLVKIAAAVVALVAVVVMVAIVTRPGKATSPMPMIDEGTMVPYNSRYPTTTVQAP